MNIENNHIANAISELAAAQIAAAEAQQQIAAQLGRIADQITPSANEMEYPGNFANYMAYSLTSRGPDYTEALEQIADALAKQGDE